MDHSLFSHGITSNRNSSSQRGLRILSSNRKVGISRHRPTSFNRSRVDNHSTNRRTSPGVLRKEQPRISNSRRRIARQMLRHR